MATIEKRRTCTIIKGGHSRKIYIVGHASGVNNTRVLTNITEPLNLTTHFNTPLQVFFYCNDGHTLTLNSGNVVGGVNRLPPVTEIAYLGRRIRDFFIYPPKFTLPNQERASPHTSLRMLEQAVDYNERIDFHVGIVERCEKVRFSDILSDICNTHRYQYVHALFCRSF
ncbi:Uncharacterised protein [Yersinia enterocolitica]|uniref:putative adhesin n=1 Tax=Yersinia mollaretii TaxID=33060 RepID=UPI0005E09E30|nr:hypothetical protein [Yersinia mollaretii]CNK97135.1 Uncharacterised protein [Yersinia enterocolitica]